MLETIDNAVQLSVIDNAIQLLVLAGCGIYAAVLFLRRKEQVWFLLMRGFGTGAMHIVCGAIVGYGLLYVWKRPWLKAAGTFGLLCIAITFHAIFNLLLSVGGTAQTVGLLIPIFTILSGAFIAKLLRPKLPE